MVKQLKKSIRKQITMEEYLFSVIPNVIFKIQKKNGLPDTYYIDAWHKHLKFIVLFIRKNHNCEMNVFMDLISADYLGSKNRFTSIYHFLSFRTSNRFFIRIKIPKGIYVSSITFLFMNAHWYERESYDLFGILYSESPDLRRIFNDYNFRGYPLRKDFPLVGYIELRYDAEARVFVANNVSLVQDFRQYKTLTPWSTIM